MQGLDASYGPSTYPTQLQHQQHSQDDPFAASSRLHSDPFGSSGAMPSGGGSTNTFGSMGAGNGGSAMFGGSDFGGPASHQRTTSSASSNNPFAPGAGLHSAGPSLQSQGSTAHGVLSPTSSMSGGYPGPSASTAFQAPPSSNPSSSGGPAGPAGNSAAYPGTNLYPSIYSGTGSQGSGQYAQPGRGQDPNNGGGQYAQQGQGSSLSGQQAPGSQAVMPNGFGQLQAPGAQQRSLGSGQVQAPSSIAPHQQPAPAADGFESNTFGGPSNGVEGGSHTSSFGGGAAPPRAGKYIVGCGETHAYRFGCVPILACQNSNQRSSAILKPCLSFGAGSMAALRAQKVGGQQPQQQPSLGQTGSGIWQSGSGVPLSSNMSTNSGWQSRTTTPQPKQGSSSDNEFDIFFANRWLLGCCGRCLQVSALRGSPTICLGLLNLLPQ